MVPSDEEGFLSKFQKGSVIAVLVAVVSLVAAVSAFGGSDAASATTVTVTAGKPSEFKFILSKKTIVKGVTTFKVTNKGTFDHDFKIAGKKTVQLKAGKTATLKVTFKKAGKFPFLCTLEGHAAAGMKGTLTVKAADVDPLPTSSSEGAGDGALVVLYELSRLTTPDSAVAARRAAAVASTISAPIATATSSGERAPIAIPIGAWMRAISASPTPSARSRSSRSAVVTLLPIAPM